MKDQFYNLLHQPLANLHESAEALYQKSISIVLASQLGSGGTVASPKGTRYAGFVYPRDHAYTVRSFVASDHLEEAKKGLTFILNCTLSDKLLMFQRYNEQGEDASNKPPQIDGNAQTIIALGDYMNRTQDYEFFLKNKVQIDNIIGGLFSHIQEFPHGSLVFSINGIIEFAPVEEGFEIYTNAVCFKALSILDTLYSSFHKKATPYGSIAEKIQKGIEYYLYYPQFGGFVNSVRGEPNPSIVLTANLKSFLSLVDFDVFSVNDEKIKNSIEFQLQKTKNEQLGGYNRYQYEVGRHNFGDGPWPMVMLRLAEYFSKVGDTEEAKKLLTWVINAALQNKDIELGLPEHIVTTEVFDNEYDAFIRTNDISPRPAKFKEYKTIEQSNMYKNQNIVYAINPLLWSHSQFILTWNKIKNMF